MKNLSLLYMLKFMQTKETTAEGGLNPTILGL